ncbi:MAG: hypothetical protein O7E57_02435 [Gammaproteobacteria bacterium]|nr:hypothetical protein [Gammaproteobacteria bacterium]
MGKDSLERAEAEAMPFEGLSVIHVWDPKRQVGDMFATVLQLESTAWDFYFLYPPGVTWDDDEPPLPAFWMHQLPAASGADRDLVLYPTRFLQELFRLFAEEVEPKRTSRDDLGLQLHWEGLVNMTRKRSDYTLEHVHEAFEASKIERGN